MSMTHTRARFPLLLRLLYAFASKRSIRCNTICGKREEEEEGAKIKMNALLNVDGNIRRSKQPSKPHQTLWNSYFRCLPFSRPLADNPIIFFFYLCRLLSTKEVLCTFTALSCVCVRELCERQAYLLRFYFSFGTNFQSTNKNDNKDTRNEE